MSIDLTLNSIMLGISLLSAMILISRARLREIYIPLAAFFGLNAITDIIPLIEGARPGGMLETLLQFAMMQGLPIILMLPVLFWMYTRNITAKSPEGFRRQDLIHFIPALLSYGLVFGIISLPGNVRETIFHADWTPQGSWEISIAIFYMFFSVFSIMQIGIYIALIIKRLWAYRSALQDHFSSTEALEMRWIFWLSIIIAGYWVLSIGLALSGGFSDGLSDNSLLDTFSLVTEVILIFAIALWGLRQTPGFESHFSSPEALGQKYQKSGLSDTDMQTAAVKILAAVETDKLHQNPNLSLSDLSRHIRMQPNYVSQSLNGVIGESFFDFINHWRIKDAIQLLETTDATILEITYAANFNSRSSFYKAFKRETGLTPTAYRAQMKL